MAEHIQARGGADGRRHGSCIERVTDSKGWLERPVGDARFSPLVGKVTGSSEMIQWWEQWNVQDSGTSGFTSCPGSGGNAYQRAQGFGDW